MKAAPLINTEPLTHPLTRISTSLHPQVVTIVVVFLLKVVIKVEVEVGILHMIAHPPSLAHLINSTILIDPHVRSVIKVGMLLSSVDTGLIVHINLNPPSPSPPITLLKSWLKTLYGILPDSSTTHHITNDFANLNVF